MDGALRSRRAGGASVDIGWRRDGSTFYGVATSQAGEVVCRLIVEPLPNGEGWDWATWRSVELGHGVAPSPLLAMEAAQQTAMRGQ
jgi:hypothetical protein